VFLLTDGAVTNTEEVLDLVGRYETVISTLGIGNAASVNLVRGVAERTGGLHEFIDDNSKIEAAVVRSLTDTVLPVVRHLSVESDCGELMKHAPVTLGQNRLVSLEFYANHSSSSCFVEVKGFLPNGEKYLRIMNSRTAIRRVSKSMHCHSVAYAAERDIISVDETMELAERLKLMTKLTSLLLYDPKVVMGKKRGVTEIPVVARWGGGGGFHQGGEMDDLMGDGDWSNAGGVANLAMAKSVKVSHVESARKMPKHVTLIQGQTASGFWKSYADVCDLLGIEKVRTKWGESETATAIAIEYLRKESKTVYVEVIRKSEDWLGKVMKPEDVAALLAWAAGRV
jgi:hypothetical protein